MRPRNVWLWSRLLLLSCCAISLLPACRGEQASGKQHASVALLPLVSSAPVFLAKERGYFDAQHIDLELKLFHAAQPVAVAVAANDAEFGVTAFTGAFFNLAGKGALKVIAAQSREEPGYQFVAYVATKRAYDAGLRAPAQLQGKSVAISTLGSSFHYDLGLLAQKYGWPLSSIQMKPMQSLPNMLAALASGQVDAALLPANLAFKTKQSGTGEIIGWVADQTPWQLGALFAARKTVEQDRGLVERFVRAYQRGLADYTAAFLSRDAQGKRVFGDAARAALPLLRKWVEPKPSFEQLTASANYMDPLGRLRVADIYAQVAWYEAQGLVDPGVEPAHFLDLGFVQGHFDVPAR